MVQRQKFKEATVLIVSLILLHGNYAFVAKNFAALAGACPAVW